MAAAPRCIHAIAAVGVAVRHAMRNPDRAAGGRAPCFVRTAVVALAPACIMLVGCDGPQSTLAPAGAGAERIADLFWGMTIAATVIWLLVMGLATYATRLSPRRHSPTVARWLIVGGGIVFPSVSLAGLLFYALSMMEDLREPGGDLRVEVIGQQWWWQVRYWPAGAAEPVEVANEVRLPLGERVGFSLASRDVIHSFWIPSLGGKVDMIPGRTNRLVLEPTKTGVFRGACAEYCGASHTKMAFYAETMEPAAFADWLSHQAAPATPPASPLAQAGRDVFFAAGCNGCHTIRGTPAAGLIGPDLTHVGSRLSLGAGILPNDVPSFVRWVGATEAVKPGVHMPAFAALGERDLTAIGHYLENLQ